MDIKKAKDILEKTNFLTFQSSFAEEYKDEKDLRIAAFSFLEGAASRDALIKELVGALQKITNLGLPSTMGLKDINDWFINVADNALTKYRDSLKAEEGK